MRSQVRAVEECISLYQRNVFGKSGKAYVEKTANPIQWQQFDGNDDSLAASAAKGGRDDQTELRKQGLRCLYAVRGDGDCLTGTNFQFQERRSVQ